MWIGTPGSGLFSVQTQNGNFDSNSLKATAGLNDKIINSIVQSPFNNELYVGIQNYPSLCKINPTTGKIEELINELKLDYTIAIVTHNMQQAARISDYSGYMLLGEMIEFGPTAGIFTSPQDKRTQDYVSGRYG